MPNSGSRLLRLFSTAVIDQVLLSGASFLIGFLLIRHTTNDDYGLFVLVQSAITLLICAQAAWLSGPMSVVAPKKPPEVKQLMIGAVETSQHRFLMRLTALALVVPPVLYLFKLKTGVEVIVIAIGVLAGWTALQREYHRSVLLMYARPQSMLRADIVYVVVLLGGAAVAVSGLKPAVIFAVTALAAAAWAGSVVARRSLARDPGWVSGDAAPYWRELRPLGIWSTVGAVIYWVFSQSYNYVLAGQLNLTAVADVNAARLLVMPTMVLTVGVKSLLTPSATVWFVESGLGKLIKRLTIFIVGIALLDLLYLLGVWIFRDWLTGGLMHKTIGDRDRLLILWAVISLIGLTRDMFQTAVLVLQKFKPMAWLTGLSAIVALSMMWFGISLWGPAAALIGQIAGESISLIGVLVLLMLARASPEPRTATT